MEYLQEAENYYSHKTRKIQYFVYEIVMCNITRAGQKNIYKY